ncbi:PA2169 family four-helix-bundle protein [soil metagenome]
MEKKEEVTQVLNDLLKINNDRIREYRKGIREIVDFDWRTIFLTNIDESKKFGNELALAIINLGGNPETGSTTTSGKIYRFWTELKDTFTGTDRESILNECEFVEDGVLLAYTRALEHEDLTIELNLLIKKQLASLRTAYVIINKYRDMGVLDLYNL